MGCVYIVTNRYNGKYYIGKTDRTAQQRWQEHLFSAKYDKQNNCFYNAVNKHGREAFDVNVLSCGTGSALSELEKLWILVLDATNKAVGYNSKFGGDNGLLLQVTKNKIAKQAKRRFENPAEVEKYRKLACEGNYAAHLNTPEANAKKVAFHTGRKRSEETRKKLSEKAKLRPKREHKPHTAEAKKKMSIARRKNNHLYLGRKRPAHSAFLRAFWSKKREQKNA